MRKTLGWIWISKTRILAFVLMISIMFSLIAPIGSASAQSNIQNQGSLESMLQDITATTSLLEGPENIESTEIANPTQLFEDIDPSDWFYNAVRYVYENDIFNGTGDATFSPNGSMTRAMYLTALGRMLGIDVTKYSKSSFSDVTSGSWYAPYVEWAAEQGITNGTGNSRFSPNGIVTREQMITMTLRFFELYEIPYETENPQTTVPADLANVAPWAVDAVVKLWQAGLYVGNGSGYLYPNEPATRAEAAVTFMRNNQLIDAWQAQSPDPIPTPIPTPSPTAPISDNSGGYSPTPTPVPTHKLTFDSNGGSIIEEQIVKQGAALNDLPVPSLDGHFFQGWFSDEDLVTVFADGSSISEDTTLYAKYLEKEEKIVKSVPIYSVLDVDSNFKLEVIDKTGNMTATQVEEGMTFKAISNPDFEGIEISGNNSEFTVSSAADGEFVEGNTYQLTLTDENLAFKNLDTTTTVYVFSVAKEEVLNIPLNRNMLYIPFANITNMTMDGEEVESPSIPVVSASVGETENTLAEANAASGTFSYSGDINLEIGSIVAIYEGTSPNLRTLTTSDDEDGEVAYIRITTIIGSTFGYTYAKADEVLAKPDILPISVDADTDEDDSNLSINISSNDIDYSDSLYEEFNLNELTTVDVDDFISFYEGSLESETTSIESYAKIKTVRFEAENIIITYEVVTFEDIEKTFDIFQTEDIDSETLLSDEQIVLLEKDVEKQARASGFVTESMNYLAALAFQSNGLQTEVSALGLGIQIDTDKVTVENVEVDVKFNRSIKHIPSQQEGVSAELTLSGDVVLSIGEESSLVIHLTGTFVQEIAIQLNVSGESKGRTHYNRFGIPYWYSIDDYVVSANLDAYTYTGVDITAEIAAVENDKLEAALNDWLGEKNAGRLGTVLNIADEIEAMMEDSEETDFSEESLREKYKEMLENETEWVKLIEKEIFMVKLRVAYGIIEVVFETKFVLSANVNLSVGVDFNYKSAKRYTATIYIYAQKGDKNTTSLPGDGDYQFTFYVMGTLGLRAGINMELKAGVGSVKLNSIGLSVEPGVYIQLWGYFYYQLMQVNGIESSKSLGALFVEMGIYLDVAIGAQLGDGLLEASQELVEETWPLYSLGSEKFTYDFTYEQSDNLELELSGRASSLALPEQFLTMRLFDLKTGHSTNQSYYQKNDGEFNPLKFDISIDNPNFRYNSNTQKIEVVDTTKSVSEGNLVITWKQAPLAFTSTPLKRTIPLTWLAREGDYTIQLDPQNSEAIKVTTLPYNAVVSVTAPSRVGYTFAGWYTQENGGGVQSTIPTRMPAEDLNLYAYWSAKTNTAYTVEHHLIDPNTKTSTVPDTVENLIGTTDAEIVINSTRYSSQGYAGASVSNVYINGDGSTVVRLEYEPLNKTATFDLGYTGAPTSSVTAPIGKTISSRIPVPTRKGYTFTGWQPKVPSTMPTENTTYTAKWTENEDTTYHIMYLQQNIDSESYTVVEKVAARGKTGATANLNGLAPISYSGFTLDNTISGTVTEAVIAGDGSTVLKLYYKRNKYKLTVNYNGADITTREVDVPFGSSIEQYFTAPERRGYTFASWSETPPTTMPTSSVNINAQWSINKYAVSFNIDGANETIPDQSIAYGSQVTKPANPTKAGYVFDGWYSDEDLMVPYVFTSGVTAATELHAKWLQEFTITFDTNGAINSIESIKVSNGAKATAPENPTKTDFVFSGWYTDNGFNNSFSFATTNITDNVTLFAKWVEEVKIYHEVIFNTDGAESIAAITVLEGAVVQAPTEPTKEGYTFSGWYTDSSFTTEYGFTEAVMSDTTVYVKWNIKTYAVSFNMDGATAIATQTVNHGESAEEPATPTKTGYVFKGWYGDSIFTKTYNFSNTVLANTEIYAKWVEQYTVSFDSGSGTSVDSQTIEKGESATKPTDPTKAKHRFDGWYSDDNYQTLYSFATPVQTSFTLYAKWSEVGYTITFDTQGGPPIDSQTVENRFQLNPPWAPIWEGYSFKGWYTDTAKTIAYDILDQYKEISSDLTLYANWATSDWDIAAQAIDARGAEVEGLVFDQDNTPYVLYTDYDDYKTYLKKYEDGAWASVGDSPFFEGAVGLGYSLVFDRNNNLTIAFEDNSSILRVMTYIDGEWVVLGNTNISNVDLIELVFDSNNTPYLSFRHRYYEHNNITQIMKYNGSTWIDITDPTSAVEINSSTELGFDTNNVLYASSAYVVDIQTVQALMSIRKYDNGIWSNINIPNMPLLLSETQSAFKVSPNGIPYLAYILDSELIVMKYVDNEWEEAGDLGHLNISPKAEMIYFSIQIQFDSSNRPYIMLVDEEEDNRITVLHYYADSWSVIGNRGFTAISPTNARFALDRNGIPHLFYIEKKILVDDNYFNLEYSKLHLLKFVTE